MTKKELQKRIKTTKREKEIAYWQCDNNRDQSVVVSLNRRYHILVEKLEAEELALKQLEDQKKCCANCADWGSGRDKEPDKKYPCDSRKTYDLHEEYGYIVTPPDFYCGYWRKDV